MCRSSSSPPPPNIGPAGPLKFLAFTSSGCTPGRRHTPCQRQAERAKRRAAGEDGGLRAVEYGKPALVDKPAAGPGGLRVGALQAWGGEGLLLALAGRGKARRDVADLAVHLARHVVPRPG